MAHDYNGSFNSRNQRTGSKLGRDRVGLDRLGALLHGWECRICSQPIPEARVRLVERRSGLVGPEAPVLCDECAEATKAQ